MERTAQRVAALLCAAALMVFFPRAHAVGAPEQIVRDAPLRIMALGDSITAGVNAFGRPATEGGYRGPLEHLLAEHGYHATFVGSRTDYASALDDRAHEGWPGYVVRSFPSDPGPGELYGSIAAAAMKNDDPDVVLLMAGTNDLVRRQHGDAGYTVENIVESVRLLIAEIVAAKPTVHVIVAPVVDSPQISACALRAFAGVTGAADCAPASVNLATVVDDFDRQGYRVSYAPDMVTSVPRDEQHFPDGLHPCGADGYADVASVWLNAIEAITQRVPSATAQN